jgi:hypothetical protein
MNIFVLDELCTDKFAACNELLLPDEPQPTGGLDGSSSEIEDRRVLSAFASIGERQVAVGSSLRDQPAV